MVNRELKQYKAAEEELRRATELNPNHATAHDWYGILLDDWGRKDEANIEWRRAEVLDPLSPIIKLHLLFYETRTRQYEHALAACEQNIQLFPDFVMFHSARAWLLERLGRYPEALAEALSARSSMTNSPFQLGLLGLIYARSGDIANARKILDELEESKRRGHTVRKDIALVHVALHEYDRALDEYEAAYAESAVLIDLRDDPQLDDLRSYPRFQALLAKIASKQ
jgi:Flp pilus assembly protein TadD